MLTCSVLEHKPIASAGLDTAIYLRVMSFVSELIQAALSACSVKKVLLSMLAYMNTYVHTYDHVLVCAPHSSYQKGTGTCAYTLVLRADSVKSQGTKLFSILTVWCLLTILPTNYTVCEHVDLCVSGLFLCH